MAGKRRADEDHGTVVDPGSDPAEGAGSSGAGGTTDEPPAATPPPSPARRTPAVTPAVLAARAAQVFAAPAIRAVMHEQHLGIVNSKGDPVELEDVLVKDAPAGNTRRATERIFERTTVPGADGKVRRRLLYGQDAIVADAEFQALASAVAERKSASAAEGKAAG